MGEDGHVIKGDFAFTVDKDNPLKSSRFRARVNFDALSWFLLNQN